MLRLLNQRLAIASTHLQQVRRLHLSLSPTLTHHSTLLTRPERHFNQPTYHQHSIWSIHTHQQRSFTTHGINLTPSASSSTSATTTTTTTVDVDLNSKSVSTNSKSKKVTKKIQARVEQLREEIKKADDAYYGSGQAKLKDAAYDAMYNELKELESTYPVLLTQSSPTQEPGAPATLSEDSSPHRLSMFSLQSCTSFDKVRKWHESNLKSLGVPRLSYNLELKYDGIACSFIYEKGKIKSILSRGNKTVGENIQSAVERWVKNYPKELNLTAFEQSDELRPFKDSLIEIRGEIILTTSSHQAYTAWLKSHGASTDDDGSTTPARNLCGGLLRRDSVVEAPGTSSILTKVPPPLSFVGYSLHIHHPDVRHLTDYSIPPPGVSSKSKEGPTAIPSLQSKSLQILQDLGVPITPNDVPTKVSDISYRCDDIDQVIKHLQSWTEAKRSGLNFGIDGIVIKVDQLGLSYDLGATSHHPKGILAYKFPAKSAETTLESISWQVGREGRLTPVANLKPVQVDGTLIERASLHNCNILADLDLKIGDTVTIERRGDVIPQIRAKVSSPPDSQPIKLPKTCPCPVKSAIVKRISATDENRFDLYCESPSCCIQQASKIEYYCSKKALDIEGMGPATVKELMDHGYLQSIEDVIELPSKREELMTAVDSGELPGWGAKRVDKICDNIENRHAEASEEQLLIAIGIPRLGAAQAKALLEYFGDIESILNATESELNSISGIGKKLIPIFLDAFQELKTGLIPHWKKHGVLASDKSAASRSTKKSQSVASSASEDESTTTKKTRTTKKRSTTSTSASSASPSSSNSSDIFSGAVFCVSGKFSVSQKEMGQLIQTNGGTVVDTFNKKCTYLVADSIGSSKTKKAQQDGIKIVTEAWVNDSIAKGRKSTDKNLFLNE